MKVAIVGIGNILYGDEGVGIHVINELKCKFLPPYVEVYDCNTDAFAILEAINGARKAVIVDAMRLGYKPGTVHRFNCEELLKMNDKLINFISFHQLDLVSTLKIAQLTDVYKLPNEIVVFGVEVKSCHYSTEVSNEVKQAIPKIIDKIMNEI